MDTHSRIKELANNLEIENSRNKSDAKISKFTVICHVIFCFIAKYYLVLVLYLVHEIHLIKFIYTNSKSKDQKEFHKSLFS